MIKQITSVVSFIEEEGLDIYFLGFNYVDGQLQSASCQGCFKDNLTFSKKHHKEGKVEETGFIAFSFRVSNVPLRVILS